jgi:hypothetical protein
LSGALGATGKVISDEWLPLAPEDFQDSFQATSERRLSHCKPRILTLTK